MTTEYTCAECGKKLSENERPCSNCGSIARKISVELTDKLVISDNFLRAKVKNPDIPGTKYELTKKKKSSGKTKQPTEETMIIDRSHPEKTVKKHKVKEFDGKNGLNCPSSCVLPPAHLTKVGTTIFSIIISLCS